MKSAVARAACAAALLAGRLSSAAEISAIAKVVQMVSDFQAKILAEGEASQKLYQEFSEFCEDRNRNLAHEIKNGKAEVASLKATMEEETATMASLSAKIDDLSASIATDEADLKAATEIRAKEHSDFIAEETELVETTDMLGRAVGILEREMAKGASSMMQLKNAASLSQALSVMVDVSAMSSEDVGKLQAFAQTAQGDAEDDAEPGAPAAAVYEGQSGDIINTLSSLKEKAESQLDEARKTETKNLHTFQQLEQSLKDEIKFATQDMEKAKKGLAESAETKAKAEGDLEVTSKDLAADLDSQAGLHQECLAKAQDFEAETNSRGEELKALAEAKKIIVESTGGAEKISYSLVQVARRSKLTSGAELANFAAVRMVRSLAQKQNSPALAQLAARMGKALRSGAADPFAKVKSLVSSMIARLEDEAEKDATHKAYCDKELKESEEKHEAKTAEIAKQTSRIDQMSARSATLKEETAQLQADLAALAKSQAEMDKLREEEHAAYVSSKADMEQGLDGVKLALKVLNEYYAKEGKAHTAQSGAGSSIIGLLEVVESDFSKSLAEIETTEESAAAEYDRQSKANAVEKTEKTKDVEYKQKESVYLDKEVAELSTDRSSVQAELDAVNEYLAKIHQECDEVAETYAERKAGFEAEIAGLKEALAVLENETALLQRRSVHRMLRGGVRA